MKRFFPLFSRATRRLFPILCCTSLAGLTTAGHAQTYNSLQAPIVAAPIAAPTAPPAPPSAQAYVTSYPGARIIGGRTFVPLSFLMNGLGASAGSVGNGVYRIVWFGRSADLFANQTGARLDGVQVSFPVAPQFVNNQLYVPWQPIAQWLGVRWSIAEPKGKPSNAAKTVFLLQYPAAYIQSVTRTIEADKLRVVIALSNPTRITAAQKGLDILFQLAAARQPNVATVTNLSDYLLPRVVARSGNWKANLALRLNYSAPVRWFSLGSPPRLVIEAERLFEQSSASRLEGGLALTKIRKGMADGPVQMFLVRFDPQQGWRMRVAPAGANIAQRTQPSRIASRHRALIAVNGGFFAYDGGAVGAVLVDGEWIRLPWKGRTAIAFRPDGTAKIGNLQARAVVDFSSGLQIPIRDLNGWPDKGTVSVLTWRFGGYYKLRPGEMALEVRNGVVVGKPGGGGVHVYPNGFTLIASGGARPWANKIKRGERARLSVRAVGWDGFTTALGGGPRLINNGRVEVTALREAFRADVRVGRGPRTAIGIDRQGRYIILVVDGRRPYYSIGLTLTELAATMQKLGAVEALNLDGGGSTSMVVKSRVVNHPSDGLERRVSNALLVMR